MGGKERSSTASELDPEAEGEKGEAEGRVPPGLPIISKNTWEYGVKDCLRS